LYPNPADNLIHIESKDTMVKWELNNINKNIRQSNLLNINQSKEFSIEIGEFPSGIYFLKTFFDDGQVLVRTITKR